MALDSVRNALNSVENKVVSLKERAQNNWNTRRAEVISSGVSTGTLAGGVTAATVFGGPIGLIIGAASAALVSLILFLRALFREPKTVEQPKKQEIELIQIKSETPKQPEIAAEEEQQPSFVERVKAHPVKSLAVVTAGLCTAGAIVAGVHYGYHTPVVNAIIEHGAPVVTYVRDSAIAGYGYAKDTANSACVKGQEIAAQGKEFVTSTYNRVASLVS